ncbi:MAG: bifunctional glutamate N-acetyltransferase/amino-acid acetyltransferase ArgJ [Pirellulales bacterium]
MATAASIPAGFFAAAVHCGIKRDAAREDLTLIVCQSAAVAAGVYTRNQVVAAPVVWCRQRTPSASIRAVVINSGNANACTGQQGVRDTAEMARRVGEVVGIDGDQVLVLSTGVIGERLPIECIAGGISAAAARLGEDVDALTAAARGMMTTDTVPKLSGRELAVGEASIRLVGLAKGAAMIRPDMATMLAVLLTDAPLEPSDAQRLLADSVASTFNAISVDGHMSTNDSVLLLASGMAGERPLSGAPLQEFGASLREICCELAQAIVADGEGATHKITIDVSGCASRQAAETIARTVGESPLVKTAVAGADPNWGRIVSAAGYAGVPFDPAGTELRINGVTVFRQGGPVPFDAEALSGNLRDHWETRLELRFSEGDAATRFWTADLTEDYVRLNADYHT